MNVNTRKLLTHVEFEPNTYGTAFAVELEAASSPLWSFVNACISLVGFLQSVIEVYIECEFNKKQCNTTGCSISMGILRNLWLLL